MTISSWKEDLKNCVRDTKDLVQLLDLEECHEPGQLDYAPDFPVRVPEAYLSRIQRSDPGDPLLLQVLPRTNGGSSSGCFNHDPVGDCASEVIPGVLHKYHGRVLLIATGACAIHCRYCFRQHFPYSASQAGEKHWHPALDYIAGSTDITEVILSGGDPLVLSDQKLEDLMRRLDDIPHLQRLRIHSRIPVVMPGRIDRSFLSLFDDRRLSQVLVLHINHAREIDDQVEMVLASLRRTGVMLLNQAVLLHQVNDTLAAQEELATKLVTCGILPYYLHMLDPVIGSERFEVAENAAIELMHELRTRLPGYMVPRLVRELPGEESKTTLS